MSADEDQTAARHKGLIYARTAGVLLGAGLLVMALMSFMRGVGPETLRWISGFYFALYGALLCIPFNGLRPAIWRFSYGALVALSAGFVFLMIVRVMFEYMAAAELGERLGVPGFEGSLIFIALLQVPVVLFQRHPDYLD